MRDFVKRPAGAAPFAAYAGCVLIWGTTWLAIKVALHGFPTVFGAGVRFTTAALVLYAASALLRVATPRRRPPLHLVLVLALTMFGLNYALTYFAETHLASGLVAVLFGTLPFFVFAFARVMVGERAGMMTIAGSLVAFAGVGLISLSGDVRGDFPYVTAVLAAAASSGFANVYLKRFADAEPLTTLPPAMLVAGLAMLAWGGLYERVDWHAAAQPAPLAAVAYLAVCGSALAFFLNHWLLQRIASGTMALSALMVPIIAVTVGALAGGEHLGPRHMAGALLVGTGIWLALRAGGRPGLTVAPAGQPA